MTDNTDNRPVLWVQAAGIDPDERRDLMDQLGAIDGDYHVVVASEPVELLSRDELLAALDEDGEDS